MKHKLIQTENYLLVVDDSEIKIDDLYLNQTGNVIEKLTYRIPSSGHWCKKIIAHLPLNGAPVLEGVDLLPPSENIIKSLQQPKMLVGFECGMEICENNDVVFEDGSFNKSPYRLEKKKIKNLEGKTVWVGKYIFND